MSKPRYKWWSYVKWMIRLYPERDKVIKSSADGIRLTVSYSGMPGAKGTGRPTEQQALRQMLGDVACREYEAVRRAIDITKKLKDGKERLRLIELVYWKKSHTLSGACAACHVSERTGWQWHGDFIRAVAAEFGLLGQKG